LHIAFAVELDDVLGAAAGLSAARVKRADLRSRTPLVSERALQANDRASVRRHTNTCSQEGEAVRLRPPKDQPRLPRKRRHTLSRSEHPADLIAIFDDGRDHDGLAYCACLRFTPTRNPRVLNKRTDSVPAHATYVGRRGRGGGAGVALVTPGGWAGPGRASRRVPALSLRSCHQGQSRGLGATARDTEDMALAFAYRPGLKFTISSRPETPRLFSQSQSRSTSCTCGRSRTDTERCVPPWLPAWDESTASQPRAPRRSLSTGRAGTLHLQRWQLPCRARRRGRRRPPGRSSVGRSRRSSNG
jgi:hypothetical protein